MIVRSSKSNYLLINMGQILLYKEISAFGTFK